MDGMLIEDYQNGEEGKNRKDLLLSLVQRCPTQIVLGEKKVAAEIFNCGEKAIAIGLFELYSPHPENSEVIKVRETRRCHAALIFTSLEALDVFRAWLGPVEDALRRIEAEGKAKE